MTNILHVEATIEVSPHSVHFAASRNNELFAERFSDNTSPTHFAELQSLCIRAGIFDVSLTCCSSPVLRDECELVCKRYGWTLMPCP